MTAVKEFKVPKAYFMVVSAYIIDMPILAVTSFGVVTAAVMLIWTVILSMLIIGDVYRIRLGNRTRYSRAVERIRAHEIELYGGVVSGSLLRDSDAVDLQTKELLERHLKTLTPPPASLVPHKRCRVGGCYCKQCAYEDDNWHDDTYTYNSYKKLNYYA